MRKFYQQDVPFEQWGRILIECTAKVLYLAPTVIYEQETMLTALAEKIALKAVEEADAWSITEWLSYYRDRFFCLVRAKPLFLFLSDAAIESARPSADSSALPADCFNGSV